MPQVYDEEGPLYVVSPKGFSTVLRRAEVNLPTNEVVANPEPLQTVTRSLVYLRGEPYFSDIPPAHQLALAVLKGDTGAALLLADLVQEQHTGSRSELQAEVAKRVTLAIEKEREKCAQIADRVALMESAASGPGALTRRLTYVAGEIAQTIRCQKAQ